MKFLFTMHPMFGHLHPLVPLARALQDRGHQVTFATAAGFIPTVERTGCRAVAAGVDHDGKSLIFLTLKRLGLMDDKAPPGPHVFSEILAPIMVADLLDLAKAEKPDLILRDPVELGGCIAAEVLGIPHAAFSWAYHWPKATVKQWWSRGYGALRERYNLPKDPELERLNHYLTIDYMPPSWQSPATPAPDVAHSFHAPLFDHNGVTPALPWLEKQNQKPKIYATLGTALNNNPPTFQAFVDALASEPCELIITLGPGIDPKVFHPIPDHIHVASYIPQTQILPHCDAVIAHGGYNTLLAALHHGLPLVLTPLTAKDQPVNAKRCEQMGVGIVVQGKPPAPERLRNALREVLGNPDYGRRCRRLSLEMRNLPPLSQAVTLLENLVQTGTPQVNAKPHNFGTPSPSHRREPIAPFQLDPKGGGS